jgi:hypothetical protein
MTKFVSYTVEGVDVKRDAEWRRKSICGIDKEYSIMYKRTGSYKDFFTLKIRIGDDTALLFKLRYPHCKITPK